MSRRAARITHDEVTRMVKAVLDLGLPVGRVVFDGSALSIVIGGESGEDQPVTGGQMPEQVQPIREPKL